jgi:predicted CoA-binding protein
MYTFPPELDSYFMFQNPSDDVIRDILTKSRTIAVVGCSPKEYRDSHSIARLLIHRGHTVTPVNPGHRMILGRDCYRDLLSIPEPIEMIDVFRRSEYVPGIVDQAIQIGAKIFWTQLGVYHEEAAEKALAAGLTVIMNRCPAIEYRRLGL